jgi:hypothetical protein
MWEYEGSMWEYEGSMWEYEGSLAFSPFVAVVLVLLQPYYNMFRPVAPVAHRHWCIPRRQKKMKFLTIEAKIE